jgi:thiol-disulfide isomerase/thioredoxin
LPDRDLTSQPVTAAPAIATSDSHNRSEMTNDMPDMPPAPRPPRRAALTGATVLVVAALGVAALYGSGWLRGRAAGGDPACRGAVSLAGKITPLIHGEVAALTPATTALKLPDLAFEDGSGAPKKLSDFRGKTVLLNLWATWCVPCRKEMPALDRLQAKLGGANFQVVAVNIDTRDPEKPKAFLDDAKLTRLDYFSDQKAKVFQDLKSIGRALGMPTSVLVDGKGCEIATIAGPAEWDSDDAIKLIQAATQPVAAGL